ncbi:MAG: hypothetical protein AAF702_37535 [Chloroflexota bacterium]
MQHGQTVFLIEQIQPNWLAKTNRFLFQPPLIMLIAGPLYGLIGGAILGVISGIILGTAFWILENVHFSNHIDVLFSYALLQDLVHRLITVVKAGGVIGLFTGLFIGLTIGLIELLTRRFREIVPYIGNDSLKRRTIGSLYGALFGWLFIGPLFGLTTTGIADGFSTGIIVGVFGGMFGGMLGGLNEIEPANYARLTLEEIIKRIHWGLVFGLVVVLANIAVFGLWGWFGSGFMADDEPSFAERTEYLMLGFERGGISWLLGGILSGLIFQPYRGGTSLDSTTTHSPNQGIRLSVRYALLSCTIVLMFSIATSVVWLVTIPGFTIITVAYAGIVGAFIISLFMGGDSAVKHLLLRIILWCNDSIPWDYARFLDYCHDRIFLRKVGGGYIFIHRMLMEHFAEMTDEDIERIAKSVEPQ